MRLYLIVAAVSYLLGSIPFGYILVKTFRGQDIRLSGSGNIGATNVVRSGAKGLGVATLVLDAAKGMLAVAFAWKMSSSFLNACDGTFCSPALRLMSLAALFAVLGHVFPVWLRFKGGKGVATALGVFSLIFPKAVLVAAIVFVLVVVLSRYVSLGSILACLTFALAVGVLYGNILEASSLFVDLAVVAVLIMHRANITRLLNGTENRLGAKATEKGA